MTVHDCRHKRAAWPDSWMTGLGVSSGTGLLYAACYRYALSLLCIIFLEHPMPAIPTHAFRMCQHLLHLPCLSGSPYVHNPPCLSTHGARVFTLPVTHTILMVLARVHHPSCIQHVLLTSCLLHTPRFLLHHPSCIRHASCIPHVLHTPCLLHTSCLLHTPSLLHAPCLLHALSLLHTHAFTLAILRSYTMQLAYHMRLVRNIYIPARLSVGISKAIVNNLNTILSLLRLISCTYHPFNASNGFHVLLLTLYYWTCTNTSPSSRCNAPLDWYR
jgi:hypothetical protein